VDEKEECRYITDVVWKERTRSECTRSAYYVVSNLYNAAKRSAESEEQYTINGRLLDMLDAADNRLETAAESDIPQSLPTQHVLSENLEALIKVRF
jgi:hypothetical protein